MQRKLLTFYIKLNVFIVKVLYFWTKIQNLFEIPNFYYNYCWSNAFLAGEFYEKLSAIPTTINFCKTIFITVKLIFLYLESWRNLQNSHTAAVRLTPVLNPNIFWVISLSTVLENFTFYHRLNVMQLCSINFSQYQVSSREPPSRKYRQHAGPRKRKKKVT